MINLKQYRVVYEILSIPHILFAGITEANQLYYWQSPIEVPPTLKPLPIECRFLLFDPEGVLVELVTRTEFYATVTSVANVVPLEMVHRLLEKQKSQTS